VKDPARRPLTGPAEEMGFGVEDNAVEVEYGGVGAKRR